MIRTKPFLLKIIRHILQETVRKHCKNVQSTHLVSLIKFRHRKKSSHQFDWHTPWYICILSTTTETQPPVYLLLYLRT